MLVMVMVVVALLVAVLVFATRLGIDISDHHFAVVTVVFAVARAVVRILDGLLAPGARVVVMVVALAALRIGRIAQIIPRLAVRLAEPGPGAGASLDARRVKRGVRLSLAGYCPAPVTLVVTDAAQTTGRRQALINQFMKNVSPLHVRTIRQSICFHAATGKTPRFRQSLSREA